MLNFVWILSFLCFVDNFGIKEIGKVTETSYTLCWFPSGTLLIKQR